MVWFCIIYYIGNSQNDKKRTYVRADNPREAKRVAEIRLKERYIENVNIVEVKAI